MLEFYAFYILGDIYKRELYIICFSVWEGLDYLSNDFLILK
jgi:hypothetical protein